MGPHAVRGRNGRAALRRGRGSDRCLRCLLFDFSGSELLALTLVTQITAFIGVCIGTLASLGKIRAMVAWLRGDSALSGPEAWQLSVDLPLVWVFRIALVNAVLQLGIIDVYVAEVANLSFLGYLAVAGPVQVGNWMVAWIVIFASEFIMRPIRAEIIQRPDAHELRRGSRLGLRTRLVVPVAVTATLAAVFTGAVVGEFADPEAKVLAAAIAGTALALVCGWIFWGAIGNPVLGPIQDLVAGAERVGAGDLGQEVPATSADELGELAEAFNRMQAGLKEREALRDRNAVLVDELRASRTHSAGLQNMADRIGALGGELRVDSQPGVGTVVQARVPVR